MAGSRTTMASGEPRSSEAVTEGREALQKGDLGLAWRRSCRILVEYPAEVDAINLVGGVLIHECRFVKAAFWFAAATVGAAMADTKRFRLNEAMARELAGETDAALQRYDTLYAEAPDNQTISNKLASLRFRTGDLSGCLELLESREKLAFDQYYMRARALAEERRFGEAEADLRAALGLAPLHAESRLTLASIFSETGRFAKAEALLATIADDAKDRMPQTVAMIQGRISASRRQFRDAADFFRVAADHQDVRVEATRFLGLALYHAEDFREAIPYLEAVADWSCDDLAVVDCLGQAFRKINDHEKLTDFADRLLGRDPSNPSVWNAVCIHLKEAGFSQQALDWFRKAVVKFPNQPVILSNLGHHLNKEFLAEEAEQVLRRSLLLAPEVAKPWNALSVACCITHRVADAMRAVRCSLFIDPVLASAWLNLGVVHRANGRFTHAVQAMKRSIELDAKDPSSQTNLAYALLIAGELEQGFRQYDTRWMNPAFPSPRRPFRQRVWEGEGVPGRKLVVYMEQGMGDEIMFAWYFPLLKHRFSDVVIECDSRLVDLFARSFPYFEVVPRTSPLHAKVCAPQVAFKAPAGHLPKFFWYETRQQIADVWMTARQAVVRTPGYLIPDPGRREFWRNYLDSVAPDTLRVGICWRSSTHTRVRDLQYLQPEEIAAPFSEGCSLFNIQYDWLEEEADTITRQASRNNVDVHTPPGIDLRDDLDDLTALCAELDIVVTPLISTAFMAAAVGTPTLVFRTSDCDRIWQMLGTPFVPWFPSMTIFFRHPKQSWDDTSRALRATVDEVIKRPRRSFRPGH